MKITIPLLTLVYALIACNPDRENQLNLDDSFIEISENLNPTQIFTISNVTDTILVGKQGTQIFITANSLEFDNGNKPQAEISISLKEFYTNSDMIFRGLSTTSNGGLLVTSGMINITAESENRSLTLKPDSPVKIRFKRLSEPAPMQTYLGYIDSNRINWLLDTANIYDTLRFTRRQETIIALAYGADSSIVLNQTLGVVGKDTLILNSTQSSSILDEDTTANGPISKLEESYYEIYSTKLNWINCDYFLYSPDNLNVLTTRLDTFSTSRTYLIFKDLDAIMESWEIQNGLLLFRNIPNNSEVTILSIVEKDNEYFYALTNQLLKKNNEIIKLEYKKSTLENISKIIGTLDESS